MFFEAVLELGLVIYVNDMLLVGDHNSIETVSGPQISYNDCASSDIFWV